VFFSGKEDKYNQIGTGYFNTDCILSLVKRAEFVRDRV
jgi:hypothetical protein